MKVELDVLWLWLSLRRCSLQIFHYSILTSSFNKNVCSNLLVKITIGDGLPQMNIFYLELSQLLKWVFINIYIWPLKWKQRFDTFQIICKEVESKTFQIEQNYFIGLLFRNILLSVEVWWIKSKKGFLWFWVS